jgi:regulator of protease activity HflC (stomatin/prohibitin superfamily)
MGLIVIPLLLRATKYSPVGYVGIMEAGGVSTPKILTPGLKLVNPLSEVSLVSTRIHDLKEVIETTSVEGAKYNVEVSLQYRLEPSQVLSIYKTIGTDNNTVIVSRFRSLVREVTATYPLQDAISIKRREVAAQFKARLQDNLAPLGLIVEEVLLREVVLPDSLQEVIDQKIRVQQENEQIALAVDKTHQEAKIARVKAQAEAETRKIEAQSKAQARLIEAQAQKEAQALISSSLTPTILRLKSIESAEKIGTSANAKVYVGLGNSSSAEVGQLFDQILDSRSTGDNP